MSDELIGNAKRAMTDDGVYKGDVKSQDWGSEEQRAWLIFCDRHGAQYSDSPELVGQTPEFKAILDNYKEEGYTKHSKKKSGKKGVNLENMVPDDKNDPNHVKVPDNMKQGVGSSLTDNDKKALANKDEGSNKNTVQLEGQKPAGEDDKDKDGKDKAGAKNKMGDNSNLKASTPTDQNTTPAKEDNKKASGKHDDKKSGHKGSSVKVR